MNRNLLLTVLITGTIATQSFAATPDNPVVVGAVYAMTNDTEATAIVAFGRYDDGTLTPNGTYPTDGQGGYAGDAADALGSENPLVLNKDKSRLYAVNAGSDSISVFEVLPDGLDLVQTIGSHGSFPVSIALYQDLLYVLDSGGDGSIAGFHVGPSGKLTPIPGSTQNLGAGGTNPPSFVESPAQVSFDPTGHWLVVTIKALNEIRLYEVDENGLPASEPVINASNGSTPFGFGFDASGHLIVAEAFGPAAPGVGGAGATSS